MFVYHASLKGMDSGFLDGVKGLFMHIIEMFLTTFKAFLVHLFITHGLG